MPNTYSDIRRYDLEPVFLSTMAKQVITDMGWVTKQETKTDIIADVPQVNGNPKAIITIRVCHGWLNLKCDAADYQVETMENAVIIDKFLQALDKQIEQVPREQRISLKEAYGLTYR